MTLLNPKINSLYNPPESKRLSRKAQMLNPIGFSEKVVDDARSKMADKGIDPKIGYLSVNISNIKTYNSDQVFIDHDFSRRGRSNRKQDTTSSGKRYKAKNPNKGSIVIGYYNGLSVRHVYNNVWERYEVIQMKNY